MVALDALMWGLAISSDLGCVAVLVRGYSYLLYVLKTASIHDPRFGLSLWSGLTLVTYPLAWPFWYWFLRSVDFPTMYGCVGLSMGVGALCAGIGSGLLASLVVLVIMTRNAWCSCSTPNNQIEYATTTATATNVEQEMMPSTTNMALSEQ